MKESTITKILWVLILSSFFIQSLSVVNVHLIPHTHIDQGWLRTIDGYRDSVYSILNSVVAEMKKGADRTFNWGEVYYFKGWYMSIDSDKRAYVRHLIDDGRFSFVGNGWIENDEACPSFESIVDQMSYGIEWLREEFGVEPHVSWDIDSFGHDFRMVSVLHDMGYEAMIVNRVPYKVKETMIKEKSLEFIWKLGEKEMFTHTFFKHYSAPQGYDFEDFVSRVNKNNVNSRAAGLLKHFDRVAKAYQTSHILVMVGDDFKWKQAKKQYESWDLLINYINKNEGKRFHVKYSTAEQYFKNVFTELEDKKTKLRFPVITHDFFQYLDNVDAIWSGFYSTHPKLKHHIRASEQKLAIAETLLTFQTSLGHYHQKDKDFNFDSSLEKINSVREAVGVSQHHDAITGTAKKRTVSDYMIRLDKAMDQSDLISTDALNYIMNKDSSSSSVKVYRGDDVFDYVNRPEETTLKIGEHKTLFAVNSLLVNQMVTMNIISETPFVNIEYTNPKGEKERIQSIQIIPRILLREGKVNSKKKEYVLYFKVPVVAFSVLKISIQATTEEDDHKNKGIEKTKNLFYTHKEEDSFSFDEEFELLSQEFENEDFFHNIEKGNLENFVSIENRKYRVQVKFEPEFEGKHFELRVFDKEMNIEHVTHESIFKEFRTSKSGAYIFRPNSSPVELDQNSLKWLYLNHGQIVSQLTLVFDRFMIRFQLPILEQEEHEEEETEEKTEEEHKEEQKEQEHEDIFHGVSSPLDDYIHVNMFLYRLPGNREVVFQLGGSWIEEEEEEESPELLSYDGSQFVPREYKRNFGKFPIAGKYYPSTSGGVLRSEEYQLTALSSSSQGVSIETGKTLSFLVHRRLNQDDGRGMGEGNNDETVLNNEFYIQFGERKSSGSDFAQIQQASNIMNRKIGLFYTEVSSSNFEDGFYFLKQEQDDDDSQYLDIFSLDQKKGKEVVVRIRNLHYSKEIVVDIDDLFGVDRIKWKDVKSLDNGDIKRVEEVREKMDDIILPSVEGSFYQFKVEGGMKELSEEEAQALAPIFVSAYGRNEFDSLLFGYDQDMMDEIILPNSIKTFRLQIESDEKNFEVQQWFGTHQSIEVRPKEESIENVEEKVKELVEAGMEEVENEKNKKEQEKEENLNENIQKSIEEVKREMREKIEGKKKIEKAEKLFELREESRKSSGRMIFFYFVLFVVVVFVMSFIFTKLFGKKKKDTFLQYETNSRSLEKIY